MNERMGETDLAIHPATAADVAGLAALVDAHPLFARYAMRSSDLAARLTEAIAASDHVLVAQRGGAPVGCAWWVARGAFSRSPYLRLLVVDRRETGRGTGTRLMDVVERIAFERANDLFALVQADNVRAQRFYERRGFERVGTLHDYVAPGLDECIVRKRNEALPESLTAPPR